MKTQQRSNESKTGAETPIEEIIDAAARAEGLSEVFVLTKAIDHMGEKIIGIRATKDEAEALMNEHVFSETGRRALKMFVDDAEEESWAESDRSTWCYYVRRHDLE